MPGVDIEVIATARGKRTRQATQPMGALPALGTAQQALLRKWLKADARERAWQSLLDAAGLEHLDVAESLLALLLQCGAVAVKEEFHSGHWRPWRVVWVDVEALQTQLGLPTRSQRAAHSTDLQAQLHTLAQQHPWLAAAAHSLLDATLPASTKAERTALLHALVQWQQGERQGMRQDFALAARNHTKGITATEWDWLAATTALEALGIGQFEPLLWLAGTLALRPCDAPGNASGTVPSDASGAQGLALAPWGFVGLPCRSFSAPLQVLQAPTAYWLIENRASFERQSARLEPGQCLVWLPGRPSQAWQAAMRTLLALAPAPAAISCDPDPAGIQIALTAGALWQAAGLPWQTQHMAPEVWSAGTTLPLNDYDRRVLGELQTCGELPPDLAALRDHLLAHGRKAEQEGWL